MFTMEAKDVVQSVVLVLGLLGAAWKWGFEERLRRAKEIPTLDGDLEVRVAPWRVGSVAVELLATWTNKGTVEVYADPKQTYLQVVEIDPAKAEGEVLLSNNYTTEGRAVFPISDLDVFVVLPGTTVPVTATICLPADRTFVARCVLLATMSKASRRKVEKRVHAPAPYIAWLRSRLFTTRPPTAPSAEVGARNAARPA